jgi:hypothetical protein
MKRNAIVIGPTLESAGEFAGNSKTAASPVASMMHPREVASILNTC